MPSARFVEGPPKINNVGKFLKSESYVCADPGKFWGISGKMCVSNPGNSSGAGTGAERGLRGRADAPAARDVSPNVY